jgi:AcrR family transcriptional regulator
MRKKSKKPKLGPGRLSANEAAKLPDRLLDAALELFNVRGYANTTMEHIAKEAGASTKTIYSRYPNKAAILRAAVNRIVEKSLAAHFSTIRVDPRDADPRDFIVSLGRQIATAISGGEGGSLVYLALSEARRFPELAELYTTGIARGAGFFRTALEDWKANGLLPDLTNIDSGARLCLSMVSDTARIRVALGKPMKPSEIESHVAFAADIFLRGCGYKSKSR